jgi:tetratricopeptide (TPR) repeat protein/transcriptional regulator with XRE-family HTH domain
MAEDAIPAGAARRERLAQRRKALGLTQQDLAGQLGVERTTVVRWELGETEPQPWMRPRLAKALRVSADRLGELLDGGPAGNSPGAGPGQGGTATAVPRQLPAAIADFTGRAAEIETLTRLLDGADGSAPGTVVISAIGGTAGVGKTALALRWAHQVAHRFRDGQLHVNLRGFDPSGVPTNPAEAIRGFLDALGVPPERVPPAPDAQAGLYRSLLPDKRMLIVLDNARDEQQVRPLLPASPGSLVLVTSRNQLAGLAAADGARLVSLDVLTHAEAVQLLRSRIGAGRAAGEPDAIAEIARLCACLPLALAVAGSRAAARPAFPLAALAAELRETATRLDALDSGDPSASVRAVFSWSYCQLSDAAARMFRLLGLHPGPDISVPAAASLAAISEPAARRLLRELVRDCLIAEHDPGRYAFHDLLRTYATAQARDCDSENDRAAASGRVLDHYLHTAGAGTLQLRQSGEPLVLAAPSPGTLVGQLGGYQQALAWFEAEHRVLLAAVTFAAESGFDRHAWQLARAITEFLYIRGHYREWAASQRAALGAATRLGDVTAQAVCSRITANASIHLGDYDQALEYCTTSLRLYRQLGDDIGEILVLRTLCSLAVRQARYADALGYSEQALRLHQATGDKPGEAEMLNNVGWMHGLLGDYQRARAFCRHALTLAVETGSRFAEYQALDSLGYIEHQLGDFAAAVSCYRRALSLCRDTGARFNEVEILTHLGDAHHAAGELRQAREAWRQALTILADLDHPDAEKVRAKLAGIGDQDLDRGEHATR